MRYPLLISGCLAATLLIPQTSRAGSITTGPFVEFRSPLAPGVVTVPTFLSAPVTLPVPPFVCPVIILDRITYRFVPPLSFITLTYIKFSIVGDPELDPVVQVTDVFARDLGGVPPLVTGFNPLNPEAVPLSDEEFIGLSGTIYSAPAVTSTVGNLPAILPGADLTPFSDPNSIVYVAQATMPLADICTPEPGGIVLLSLGILGLLGYGWHRRKRSIAAT